MKKTLFLLLAVAMFVACDKDSYRHEITLSHPSPGSLGSYLYADQPNDSVEFATFDSYRATTDADWMTIDPDLASLKINNSYWVMWQISIPITFEPNTTGETRYGLVDINNYGDDWNVTISAGFLQMGWHNVTSATIKYESYAELSGSSYPLSAYFQMTDSALQVTDTLAFTVYGNWELQCESDFLKVEKTEGEAGHNVTILTLQENESKEDRTADIFLKSSGATTTIVVTQSGVKEE